MQHHGATLIEPLTLWKEGLALPECVHLSYLRHVSLMIKVYGLQQLITCTLYNCAICIDSYTLINKFYSFIILSLPIMLSSSY